MFCALCIFKLQATQISTFFSYSILILMFIWFYVCIGGEVLNKEESELLGEILTTNNIDFRDSGIHVQQLVDGSSDLTYEEIQFVMKEKPATRLLATNLKRTLQSSKLYFPILLLYCMHLNFSLAD